MVIVAYFMYQDVLNSKGFNASALLIEIFLLIVLWRVEIVLFLFYQTAIPDEVQ